MEDIKSIVLSVALLIIGWVFKDFYDIVKRRVEQPSIDNKKRKAKTEQQLNELNTQVSRLENGMLCIERDILLARMDTVIESRTISDAQYENLQKMYLSYKSLGGNHFVDKHWKILEEIAEECITKEETK